MTIGKQRLKIIISVVAILLATTHLIFPKLSIDVITVALIALAVVPWLEKLFKSVELPGGVKLEFQDLQKIENEAKSAGLIKPENENPETKDEQIYPFTEIAEQNPELALVSLRIEIEKRLRAIANKYNVEVRTFSMKALISALAKEKLLTNDESGALNDMIVTLNQAAHGIEYDRRNSLWIIENGPKILDALDSKVNLIGGKFSHANPDGKEHWIDKSFKECQWTTNYEWSECMRKHSDLWEEELNRVYSSLISKLNGDKKALFVETQEHWQKQFELERKFISTIDDLQFKIGREGIMILATTFMRKIRDRVLELDEVLNLISD